MANRAPTEAQTQRRKWNLGDRTSLRNLHGNASNAVNSNSQYEIAKQILEDDSNDDARADYSLGIDWLLKASYEGHEGALMLLAKSLKTGRGINDRNITEVETCLAMTPAERSVRKAARELFNCLANGEHHITVAQLEKKMRQIYNLKSKTDCDGVQRHPMANEHDVSPYHTLRRNVLSDPTNNITEAHLITAAMNYSEGRLPAISSSLTLSIPHPDTLNHIPYFHRLLFHPLMFVYLIYHKYMNLLTKCPGSTVNCLLFVLLLLYTTSFGNLLLVMPVTLYYGSLLVMIVATCKMFEKKHNFDDFQMWSRLFLSFDQHVDTSTSENQFLRRAMHPYLVYFSAFFCNVIISPMIPVEWKLSSEITIVSFVLLFVTMLVFMYNNRCPFPDMLALLSFGVNVLVKFPHEMDAGWRIFDLKMPILPTFLIGNGIEFCLNSRGLLYLLMPGILLLMARRQNWHGIYQYLIPHCVTLSWLQICIISSQSATMFELIRGTLALTALLFCLPLFGIVTLMVPVIATVQSFSLTSPTMRLIASLTMAAIALMISCTLASYRRTKKLVTIFQILIFVLATFYITQPYISRSDGTTASIYQSTLTSDDGLDDATTAHDWTNLKYDLFNRYCHTPMKKTGNRISAQLKCEQFNGLTVKWEGTVTNIEINQIYNVRARLLSFLPDLVAQPILCWLGEPNELMYDVYDGDELDYLKAIFREHRKCNVNHWNSYEYRIGISMDYGPAEIQLLAQHQFQNFTKFINRSDRIWFIGILQMSGVRPRGIDHELKIVHDVDKYPISLELRSTGCVNCRFAELRPVFATNALRINSQNLYNGFKYLMNVLFNPIIKIN